MRFLLRRLSALDHTQKANSSAVAISLLAITFLQLESSPRPAGADTARFASSKTTTVVIAAHPVAPEPSDESLTLEQRSEKTLRRKIELVEKGIAFLQQTPDYTAQFGKQELVDGELLEEQTMLMKVKHAPFSVYLKWLDYDTGREVLYGDGLNDGKLLVHAGGWKARLPALSLEPDSSLALKESRHPITEVGLLNLAKKIVEFNRRDLVANNVLKCEQTADQQMGDRVCWCFVNEYRDKASSQEYRKSITLIDKEWSVPLFIKNYSWPGDDAPQAPDDLDACTLIEQYSYSDVKFRSSLTVLDFDRTNEDYGFKRQ